MNASVEHVAFTVTAVDDRTLLSPEVLDTVVTEVIRRLDRRASSAATQRDEMTIWPSVRSRGTTA
jgi:hypothetical protein